MWAGLSSSAATLVLELNDEGVIEGESFNLDPVFSFFELFPLTLFLIISAILLFLPLLTESICNKNL